MLVQTLTIQQIVENNGVIFDFDYPFYNPSLKTKFEEDFINYFYFDSIGVETFGKFKHILKSKLNLIMPYWNKIYESQDLELRILNNYELEETFIKTSTDVVTGESNSTNKNLYKDAPKTKIDIDKLDIVNSITKDEGITTNNNTNTGNENWTRKMTGNIGVATDSDAIVNYWNGLKKTTEELFEKELSVLFMGVY